MSQPPDISPPVLAGDGVEPPPPPNALSAILDLISSRIALIQLESKEVVRQWVKTVLLFVIAGLCALFAWALILAGFVSWVATAAGWPWYWVALGTGAAHLIVAWILTRLARPAADSPFPVTRSEFKKDRQWIENLQKPKKPSA